MLRASEICERAGYPTSSLVCEGFLSQAAATSVGLGMPNMPVATIVGHPGAQASEEIRANAKAVTAAEVIAKAQAAMVKNPDALRKIKSLHLEAKITDAEKSDKVYDLTAANEEVLARVQI